MKIHEWMAEHGYDQKEFAYRLEVPLATVVRWVNGHEPTSRHMDEIRALTKGQVTEWNFSIRRAAPTTERPENVGWGGRNELQDWLDQGGHTRAWLAACTGTTFSAVVRWLEGHPVPRASVSRIYDLTNGDIRIRNRATAADLIRSMTWLLKEEE